MFTGSLFFLAYVKCGARRSAFAWNRRIQSLHLARLSTDCLRRSSDHCHPHRSKSWSDPGRTAGQAGNREARKCQRRQQRCMSCASVGGTCERAWPAAWRQRPASHAYCSHFSASAAGVALESLNEISRVRATSKPIRLILPSAPAGMRILRGNGFALRRSAAARAAALPGRDSRRGNLDQPQQRIVEHQDAETRSRRQRMSDPSASTAKTDTIYTVQLPECFSNANGVSSFSPATDPPSLRRR